LQTNARGGSITPAPGIGKGFRLPEGAHDYCEGAMIDIGSCVNYGIDRVKQNPAYYVAGTLILVLAQLVINLISGMLGAVWGFFVGTLSHMVDLPNVVMRLLAHSGGMVIGTIVGIIIAPLWLGFYRGIRQEADGGKAELGVIFSVLSDPIPALLNYGAATIIVFVGFLCCFIPGILLSPLPWLVLCYLAIDVCDGFEPIKRGLCLIRDQPIIILWGIVLGLLAMIGLLACCIGILVTFPVAACAFFQMFRQADSSAPPPPTGI